MLANIFFTFLYFVILAVATIKCCLEGDPDVK